MNEKATAISLARKLKELRTAAGYSHVALAKEITDRYGVAIKDDSLLNYEIDNEFHSKAKNGLPCMRMRVDTLYCLADIYGVSLDYLLGKEVVSPGDPERRAACNCTGLSSETISAICHISDVSRGDNEFEYAKHEKGAAAQKVFSRYENRRLELEQELSDAQNGIYDVERYASADLCAIEVESLLDSYSPDNAEQEAQEEKDFIDQQYRLIATMALDGLSAVLGGKHPEKMLSLLARYLLSEPDTEAQLPFDQRFRLPNGDVFEENLEPIPITAILLELEHQLKLLRRDTAKKYVIE